MEVNVDTLEQMDLMDISDQEALDVFLNTNSVGDEGALASPLPGEKWMFTRSYNLTEDMRISLKFKIEFKIEI